MAGERFHPLEYSKSRSIQSRLLRFAALFLGLYSLAITLSPAIRVRSGEGPFRWDHWIGYAAWLAVVWIAQRETNRQLPEHDPYLLPVGALLAGWGLLEIWRLIPEFGIRQTIWLLLSFVVFIVLLRINHPLSLLRRYKYLWLTGGLVLTALTLVFGTNPSGGSPRLWLGCCGVYLQPSEPLKLLLIAYLAAYLADRLLLPGRGFRGLFPFLAPTLLMTGLALLLMVFQRDLGTAFILLFLFTAIVYAASRQSKVLLLGAAGVIVAGVAGYFSFDVVRVRLDAWLNPWADPSGGSYQIVQSLMAVANGGVLGRGPGLGSPGLVPVAHSDFIFVSIAEEMGLAGAIALLLLLALLSARGLRLAISESDGYRRYLAAGLTTFLAGQSILIIGGNLRLLPLTGVTLPFVSYGGSSLLISMISLGLLLLLSSAREKPPPLPQEQKPILILTAGLFAAFTAAALAAGWWAVVRGPGLLERTDNPRRSIADRFVQRGSLVDRADAPLMISEGGPGSYTRRSLYPPISPVLGYTHSIFGQSGLEASLDPYLRGIEGNPEEWIWRDTILYGTPPPGVDVRLSLDLALQQQADQLMDGHAGALVLIDSQNGEILAAVSHPYFDPNSLEEDWDQLVTDAGSPLFNRVSLGQYQPGASLGVFLLADVLEQGRLPELPANLSYSGEELQLPCTGPDESRNWSTALQQGCPGANIALANVLQSDPAVSGDPLNGLFQRLGFFEAPAVPLETAAPSTPTAEDPTLMAIGQSSLRVSPLQMALAAAAISSSGTRPSPVLALAVKEPVRGWLEISTEGSAQEVFPSNAAQKAAEMLKTTDSMYWGATAYAQAGEGDLYTWFTGGTLPSSQGRSLTLALILEEQNAGLAEEIGRSLLGFAMSR